MKLLKYWPRNVFTHLDRLEPYWSKFFLRHLVEQYKKLPLQDKAFSSHSIVDRTGAVPHFLNMDIEPLPPFETTPLFQDCMLRRTRELLDKKKPIKILWSGGLDSTAVLGMFLTLARPEELKRIQVILTYNSIVESGSIFDRFIKNKVGYHIATTQNRGSPSMIFPGDVLFVTGGLGDQMFGRNDMGQFYTEAQLLEPYEDHLDRNFLTFVQPSIDKFPTKIKTLFDFGWFYSFNFAWESVKHHFEVGVDPASPKFINFFGTQEFQRWAMFMRDIEPSILQTSKGIDRKTYKWPAREVILKTIGDQNYVKNKLKVVSQQSFTDPGWLALTEEGVTLYIDK